MSHQIKEKKTVTISTYRGQLKPGTKTLLIWSVPEALKIKFRKKCIDKGVSMREAVIELLESFCND